MAPNTVFLYYLAKLKALLESAERFDPAIGTQRLHANMFPFFQQAKTAISFALRTTCPLAGREIVSFSDESETFESIYREIDATMAYLSAIPQTAFLPVDDLRISTGAGFADLELTAEEYYLAYALPNFFFHYSMVYAIARRAGAPIGKADFDGYHKYPLGFHFTNEVDPADLGE